MTETEVGLRRVGRQAQFVLVEITGNHPRQVKHAEAKPRLEVAPEEGVEEVVGKNGQRLEVEDTTWVVLIDMVGMAVIYSLVKTLIFNCPSGVPKINHPPCGSAVPP